MSQSSHSSTTQQPPQSDVLCGSERTLSVASRSPPVLLLPSAAGDDEDDDDDGYRSSAEQSPRECTCDLHNNNMNNSNSNNSNSSSSGGSGGAVADQRPRAQHQRFSRDSHSFAALIEGALGGDDCAVGLHRAECSSSTTLLSVTSPLRECCINSGSLRESLATDSDTHTHGDDPPSADGHPLPMYNSDSCSTAPMATRKSPAASHVVSGGSEARRKKKRGGNSLRSTVSGLFDAAGGSGATTALAHATTARLNHSHNSISPSHNNSFGRNVGAPAASNMSAASSPHKTYPLIVNNPPIGGHHMAFQQNGVFMKESCSRREERFYEMVRHVQEFAARHPDLLHSLPDPDDNDNNEGEEEEEEEKEAAIHECQDERCEEMHNDASPHVSSGSFGGFVMEARRRSVLLCLLPFVPRFYGLRRVRIVPALRADANTAVEDSRFVDQRQLSDMVVLSDEAVDSGADGKDMRQMIVLEDICVGFAHPCILDIKMGTRQYGMHPSEKKMYSKEHKSAMTTSMQYGVRLAGMKCWCRDKQQYETKSKIAGRLLTYEELRETINRFAQRSECLLRAFREKVFAIQQTFLRQRVFRFFTSSLLFVYDADAPLLSARVVMVDFAYTYDREELRRGGDPDADEEFDAGYIKALNTLLVMLA